MDKKTFLMGLLLVSVFLSALCTEKKEPTGNGVATSTVPETNAATISTTPATTTQENTPLSDLQKDACNSADLGHTCQTKLADLEIVSPDDCCKYLGKCCPVN
jgi:hypothetical protein